MAEVGDDAGGEHDLLSVFASESRGLRFGREGLKEGVLCRSCKGYESRFPRLASCHGREGIAPW